MLPEPPCSTASLQSLRIKACCPTFNCEPTQGHMSRVIKTVPHQATFSVSSQQYYASRQHKLGRDLALPKIPGLFPQNDLGVSPEMREPILDRCTSQIKLRTCRRCELPRLDCPCPGLEASTHDRYKSATAKGRGHGLFASWNSVHAGLPSEAGRQNGHRNWPAARPTTGASLAAP